MNKTDRSPGRRFLCGFLLVVWAPFAWGADFEPWPGTQYDAAIPTSRDVLGYDVGERISSPEALQTYLHALAEAAPNRTQLVEYARTWEGRPLNYLVIGSDADIARLEDVKAGMQVLADPRGHSAEQLDALVDSLPAIVWLAHGVHGDEISSPEAALLTAYHLLAAEPDGSVSGLLSDALVVIDPVENPDGRARFVHRYQSLYGIEPQPSRIAAERVQAWPSGRTNHYLFDMNRDWFALTQPEVQGRVRAFLEFFPLVYVDLHEMDTNSSYYFPPPAVPYNPYLSDQQIETLTDFGRYTSQRFDQFGFRYFTREIYDAYYPGYGDTWPGLHGSSGMTFEMAGARGLLANRDDGTQLSYRDGVHRHFVASIATIEMAARVKARLLREFLEYRQDSGDATVYVLPRRGDTGRVDKLASLLSAQGVEVRQLREASRLCGATQPAGTYVVSASQPAGRLVGTLLATDSPLSEAFWAEQERRRAKRLPVQIYDIVAWSLPMLYAVDVDTCSASVEGYPLAEEVLIPGFASPSAAQVAYVIPWGSQASARFLAQALRLGLTVDSSDKPFAINGRQFGTGALILRVAANAETLHRQVLQLIELTETEVVALDRSWAESGVNFGSREVRHVRAPRVAMAWGQPVAVSSAGSLRYVLERKLGYPVAPVRMDNLASAYLDEFDVLILPAGNYDGALSESASANLKRWVEGGGTLVGVEGAVAYLGSKDFALLSTQPERFADPEPDADDEREDRDDDEDDGFAPGTVLDSADDHAVAVAPTKPKPPPIPGAMLNADVDQEHWLAAGLPENVRFIVRGDTVFAPLKLDKGVNVVSFAGQANLVAGGYLWEDARKQWARKPVVLVQAVKRGLVIGFAADPSFRGYMDGLDVLVANAVFRGAAHATPVRR
ncbi:MAG: M14 family metallopeptidase [Gammaproteobacteria bacterium]|nr:M14 family metallopeptidase [Gammaproteobacteria bacterium]